ncbi:MAG: PDZ domain-containing protein [Vicinamibacterales bacterium]
MTYQRTIILGGLLAALVGAAVTGVAAQRGSRDPDRDRQERGRVFVGPDGAGRAIRLDGRGSQIGVMVSDPEDAATPGVRIDGVDRDSPAEKAGVREGDIVVEFDGERVRSARQLTRLVQETPDGRTVKMTVTRGGSRQTLDITPEASAGAMSWSFQYEPQFREELERGLRGLRELPERGGPMFDFRFDGVPGMAAPRGRLGVQVETLSDQLAEYFGVKGGGVLVSTVTADSPAARAGVKAGDVITSVNGTAVRDAGELVAEIGEIGARGEARLEIVRDRKTTTVTATLERPARPRAPRPPA